MSEIKAKKVNKKTKKVKTNEEKTKRINKEFKKIQQIYGISSKNVSKKMNELAYRASFLLVMIQDMENEMLDIKKYLTKTKNASQTFLKTNPLAKDYRDTIKTYQAVLKQLDEMKEKIDEEDTFTNPNDEPDELDEFLNNE